VIAAVNGPAAGGGLALALASDVRLASPEAYFVASFINVGLSAGELGTSYLLPRLVGLSRAAEILYTGRKVHAEEAERIGLVSRVLSRETLAGEALALAGTMLGKSPGGLQLTKRVLDRNLGAASLEAAVELENRNQTMLVFSGDFFRLVQAFAKGNEKT
jgi:enoyl-CoA hydratase/carnithine racemase